MNIKDCAFPQLHSIDGDWNKEPHPDYMGMTLRDYFAAHAPIAKFLHVHDGANCMFKTAAEQAYQWADAMMKERAL